MTKKAKIGLPPVQLNDPSMMEAINKGGSTVKAAPVLEMTKTVATAEPQRDVLKSFTFKIYESELAQIREIQESLPKRDRDSIHDFVVKAVKDKINRQLRIKKLNNN